MEDDAAKSRTDTGQFAPGNSGGPGRPPGYRARVAAALDKIGDNACDEILQQLLSKAKAGDIQAIKLILDRLWPAPKGRIVRFERPEIKSTADIPKALDAVLSAVANGDLTPEEGLAVSALIEQQRLALIRLAEEESQRPAGGEKPVFVGTTAQLQELLEKIDREAKAHSP